MKRNYKILTAILTIVMSLSATLTAAAGYSGHLDGVSGDSITGWAWDSTDPESYAVVRILVKNIATSDIVGDFTTVAAQKREDLSAQGQGNGNYGFSVNMDWNGVEDGCYTVEAYAGDRKIANSLQYQKGAAGATSIPGSLKSLGSFRITGYCPCRRCSEGWGRRTSTGALARANHTIAVDPGVLPYGSKVMINGVIYTAEDRGGAVRGKHIDIFYDTHGETTKHAPAAEVFLIQ